MSIPKPHNITFILNAREKKIKRILEINLGLNSKIIACGRILIKFGIGRTTYDACQEIRNKKITREEGVNLVKLYDGEFPKKYFNDFLEYVDFSKADFLKIINSFRSGHIWKKISKYKYKLRKTVY